MEKQLVADQVLWRRVPVAAAPLLWPLAILLLGWGTGWWAGLSTVALLGAASTIVPPRLQVSIYLIDLLERVVRLPLDLLWLLLVWHLWLREPLFPILGQPGLGAIGATALLWALARLIALATRFAARHGLSRVQA